MKAKTIITLIALSGLLLLVNFCFSNRAGTQPKKTISESVSSVIHPQTNFNSNPKNIIKKGNFSNVVGSWKSEEDEKWQFKFLTDGSCIETYTGSSSDTSNYSISNTTPQCGVAVSVDQYTEYIKLSFPNDSAKNTCYLLNGTTDSTLSLSPIQSYKVFMFKKQQ
jgi:hypothetical protein